MQPTKFDTGSFFTPRKMEEDGKPFVLYHGTNMRHWEEIKAARGLRPRKQTGGAGNWQHNENDSCPSLVYLTDAYACYYAVAACVNDDDVPVVLKVTVNPKTMTLYPDEDFIFHGLTDKPKKATEINPTDPQWSHVSYRDSLQWLGTCAATFVPLSAVKAWATGDAVQWALQNDAALNPTHYQILGEQYRRQCAKLNWQPV